jgi:hypothetical protein
MSAPAKKKSGGIMSTFWRGVMIVAALGLLLAIMKAFGWDIFALIEWAFSWVSTVINAVADFFMGNPSFQKAVQEPGATAGTVLISGL